MGAERSIVAKDGSPAAVLYRPVLFPWILWGASFLVPVFALVAAALTPWPLLSMVAVLLGRMAVTRALHATAYLRLRQAKEAADTGDLATVDSHTRWILSRPMRGDLRFHAFYVRGLAAERSGSYALAWSLFAAAERELWSFRETSPPFFYARAFARGHMAFCAAADGRLDGARADLSRCHAALRSLSAPFLANVRGMHVGPLSATRDPRRLPTVAENLVAVGDARAPHTIATLAGALLAHRDGAWSEMIDLASRTDTTALLPPERALLETMEANARAHLSPGLVGHRVSALEASPYDGWADAVLDAAEASQEATRR